MLMLVGVPAPHCPLRGLGWFGTGQPGPVLGQPPASGGSWGQEHRVGLPPPLLFPSLPVGVTGGGFQHYVPLPISLLALCLS